MFSGSLHSIMERIYVYYRPAVEDHIGQELSRYIAVIHNFVKPTIFLDRKRVKKKMDDNLREKLNYECDPMTLLLLLSVPRVHAIIMLSGMVLNGTLMK